MNLLLVEDEPQVARMLSGRLARVGFNVEWVTSVPAAVGALGLRAYAVVLIDILLKQSGGRPSQDGLDVAREMRRLGIEAPFVVMTGFATFEHGCDAGALNPAAVLDKGTSCRPIVEACRAAVVATRKDTGDPMGHARAELSAVDFERPDAPDRCSAILFRAVGHAALTLAQSARLSHELVLLANTEAPDQSRLDDALNTAPLTGDSDVDRVLAVLGSIPIDSNPALSTACGNSIRTFAMR